MTGDITVYSVYNPCPLLEAVELGTRSSTTAIPMSDEEVEARRFILAAVVGTEREIEDHGGGIISVEEAEVFGHAFHHVLVRILLGASIVVARRNRVDLILHKLKFLL